MKNTKKKGFTIVELVIVIAVIGILSAILIPTFSNLVNNAKETKLQADLRNAYTAYVDAQAEHVGESGLLGIEEVIFVKDAAYYDYDPATGKYDLENTDAPVKTNYILTALDNDTTTYNGYKAYYFNAD